MKTWNICRRKKWKYFFKNVWVDRQALKHWRQRLFSRQRCLFHYKKHYTLPMQYALSIEVNNAMGPQVLEV